MNNTPPSPISRHWPLALSGIAGVVGKYFAYEFVWTQDQSKFWLCGLVYVFAH
jgi:hypothetical protein